MSAETANIKREYSLKLAAQLNAVLESRGFFLRRRSLVYERILPESAQLLDFELEMRPADLKNCVAAVYPWLEVDVGQVKSIVLEMIGGDHALLTGVSGTTLRQPIEITAAKSDHARWFVHREDSINAVLHNLHIFLGNWVFPFLDTYTNAKDVCVSYDKADQRVLHDLSQALRVAAAMLIEHRAQDAMAVMNKWFGRPAARKRYRHVFDYIAARM